MMLPKETISIKCQSLFSGKITKNMLSACRSLNGINSENSKLLLVPFLLEKYVDLKFSEFPNEQDKPQYLR